MLARTLAAMLTALVGVTLSAAMADAQTPRACIYGVNKAGAKLAGAATGEIAQCIKLFLRGALPPGSSAHDCLSADLRGKVASASSKVSAVDAARCVPPPAFGYAGAASVEAAGRTLGLDLSADLFGSDLHAAIATPKCQSRLVRNAAKVTDAQLREFLACKKSGLADATITDSASLAACLGAVDTDAHGKIDKALGRLATDHTRYCAAYNQPLFPGYCAFANDFLPCVEVRTRCRVCEAINRMDDLANDCELFDDSLANGSCGPCQPDPDGLCCNATERDVCGYCGGTGFRCGWSQISVSPTHACGLRTDGSLSCWGPNWAGELNAPPGTYTQVVSGGSSSEAVNKGHSCALRPDQTVACWGRNDYGQANPPAEPLVQLSAGSYHTCGLRPDGSITCWGGNLFGETESPPGNSFVKISTSRYSTCALRADGEAECWGLNIYGNLTPLPGPFTDIETAVVQSYAVRPDQTLAHWGEPSAQFDPPAGAYVEVDGAVANGCGRHPDGSLVCWPDDPFIGVTPPPGTFTQMDAGERIYCAVRSDSALRCWGDVYTQSGAPPK